MSKIKEIKVEEDYNDNVVWGSIDPNTGDINLYPSDFSSIIETAFKENGESVYLKNYYNARVNIKKLYQGTDTGFRHVFREELGNYTLIDSSGEDTSHLIKKTVIYNEIYKAWYLDRKTSHIGFLADISGSMSGRYMQLMEKGVEFFLNEQKTLENDTLLYGATFSNTINILYDAIDLKQIDDPGEKFYNQKTGGSTAYYDAITTLIEKIDRGYLPGDEVVICVVTDGQDNVSNKADELSVSELIKKKKKRGWMFTVIGSNLDVANSSSNYGLVREESINVGNTSKEVENVFRCVSDNVSRVRKGESKGLSYTQDERRSSNTR